MELQRDVGEVWWVAEASRITVNESVSFRKEEHNTVPPKWSLISNILWSLTVAAILLLLNSRDVSASFTTCSNPSRAGVLDKVDVVIPAAGEPAFAAIIRTFENYTDMRHSEVTVSDGQGLKSRDIIFQSPQVSVNITIETVRQRSVAHVTVNRTCYTDALEEWQPYWVAFRKFLSSKGLSK